jgi:hypothetical protein
MDACPKGLGWKAALANGPESPVRPKNQDSSPAHTPWPMVESPELPQIPTTGDQPYADVANIWPFSVPFVVDRLRLDPPKVVKR